MSEIHGQCTCGAVEFKFSTEKLMAYQCHCSICRKATGSAFSTTLLAPESGFAWLCGEEKLSSYSRGSGYKVNFCSCCGNPVPNKFRNFPLFSVPAGILDNSNDIKVVVQIYLGSGAKWDKDRIEGQQFVETPTINEMLELLDAHI